jgi:carboxypeptidase family protein
MRMFARITFAAALLALLPAAALAQTSAIAGVVKDTSGAVLPGVTVEASSPALIEKVRSGVSDSSGQYKIANLRPGTYTVTFTLPGFSVVKRENIELTSDFTASINADMKVGALEETITVSAESPVVDTQSITSRVVMTREQMDAIPTGRNIQAVGIMIPGTSIAVGGGGALSRDVGGSGNLQQSPLQYRGSGDTVQTIEGMRLNNLCAQGQYSGVYWNDGSFQEFSYVTGADSAEMGQGGMRVNMVPKDGGNSFHGSAYGNYSPSSWASDNCNSAGFGLPCTGKNLTGDTTFNKTNNFLTNVSQLTKNYDSNIGIGGPIMRDKVWFYGTFRYLGVNKTVVDSFFNRNSQVPGQFTPYVADTSRPGIDDGHIRSLAGRVAAQFSSKDKITYYHDEQDKVRGHWGIGASGTSIVTPEASAIQATPTSFVSVTKYTRTQSNKLMFDAGLAVYDQEYQENYQPGVTAVTPPLVTILDTSTGRLTNAWNNPADHFSKLFTEQFAANYITGAHSLRTGIVISQAQWRLAQQYTLDVQPVRFNNGVPVSVDLKIPTDRKNSIKEDLGLFVQDKWTISRMTINAGVRYDQFVGATNPETLPAGTFNTAVTYSDCSDGKNNLNAGCTGRVTNWKDISPRVGVAFDVFGDGKTAVKASVARYVAGTGLAAGGIIDNNNPETTVGLTDTRNWTDLDKNGSPFSSSGVLQQNELSVSTNPSFGKNVPSSTLTDPAVLEGWGARGYNWEYTVSGQHQLAPRVSLNGGWYRRKFGNQTVTVDNRYGLAGQRGFATSSFDGPFCVNAPPDASLPGGGNYQVCGLYDLKPAVVALNLPASSTIHFSSDYGGETNIYEGFEVSTTARFSRGAFLNVGINAQKRIFDQCNLVTAGIVSALTTAATEVAETNFTDGTSACHQDLPYRPDVKLLGSYTLPFDVVLSATYQFSRGVQTGGAAPSVLATWGTTPASATTLGRAYSAGATTKSVNLIAVGQNYGNQNLQQLDVRASKRIKLDKVRFRVDFDAYNLFNSDWPFTVSNTFSTATNSNWLRPTNVLQARFFKIGAAFDF